MTPVLTSAFQCHERLTTSLANHQNRHIATCKSMMIRTINLVIADVHFEFPAVIYFKRETFDISIL